MHEYSFTHSHRRRLLPSDGAARAYQQPLSNVGEHIERLTKEGRPISAQLLQMDGSDLHANKDVFKAGHFVESKEAIIGYYLIRAKNLNEAYEITKATMEIRPNKKKKASTDR